MCKDVKDTNVIAGMTTATEKDRGLLYKFLVNLIQEWNNVIALGVHIAVIPITGMLSTEKLNKLAFLLAVFDGKIEGRFRILRVRRCYEHLSQAELVVLNSEHYTRSTVAGLTSGGWNNCTFLIVTWDKKASSNPQAALNPKNYVTSDEKKPKKPLISCLGYRNLHYVEEV